MRSMGRCRQQDERKDTMQGVPRKYRLSPPLPFMTGDAAAATMGLAPIHKNCPTTTQASPCVPREHAINHDDSPHSKMLSRFSQ